MTTTTTVFIGRFGERDYVYALDKETAVALVKEHYAYGDPTVDDYAISDQWVCSPSEVGWYISETKVSATKVVVEVVSGGRHETSHISWKCPFCGESYSDDWSANDSLPVLLMCGCNERSKYLLGDRAQKRCKEKSNGSENSKESGNL